MISTKRHIQNAFDPHHTNTSLWTTGKTSPQNKQQQQQHHHHQQNQQTYIRVDDNSEQHEDSGPQQVRAALQSMQRWKRAWIILTYVSRIPMVKVSGLIVILILDFFALGEGILGMHEPCDKPISLFLIIAGCVGVVLEGHALGNAIITFVGSRHFKLSTPHTIHHKIRIGITNVLWLALVGWWLYGSVITYQTSESSCDTAMYTFAFYYVTIVHTCLAIFVVTYVSVLIQS